MSFLDKPIGEMDLEELTRLIRQTVIKEIPAIPTQLTLLGDEDTPLLRPEGLVADANALVYNQETGQWTNGLISAESIEAELILAEKVIIIGDPDGQHIRIGEAEHEGEMMEGIHSFEVDGMTVNFMLDSEHGDVYIKGRIDWGTASRLTNEDIIEIKQQATGSWQTPALVQSRSASSASGSTASATWVSPTTLGNTLIMSVHLRDPDGTPTTPTTPAGWTRIVNQSHAGTGAGSNSSRLCVYKWEDATSQSGTQSVTLGDTVAWTIIIMEYSGVGAEDAVTTVSNSGNSTSPSTGDSGSDSTQTHELWLAFLGNTEDLSGVAPVLATSPSNGFVALISQADIPGIGSATALQQVFSQNVTATGSVDMSATYSATHPWVGAAVAFKAKAVGTEAGDAGILRLHATEAGSSPALHVTDDAGETNSVALAPTGERYALEYVSATVDIPNTAAHTGGNMNVTIPGLVVGDLCFFIGAAASNSRAFTRTTRPVCGTTDTIVLDYFYTSAGADLNPASDTFYFLVIHLS